MTALFRPDRSRKANPHLEWRVGLLVAGATLGIAGIYLDEEWLRLVAIGLLAAGVVMRFLPSRGGGSDGEDGEDE